MKDSLKNEFIQEVNNGRKGPQFNHFHENDVSKTGDDDEFLEDNDLDSLSSREKRNGIKIKGDGISNVNTDIKQSMTLSIEEKTNLQNHTSAQQCLIPNELSFTNATNKLIGVDQSNSLLPLPKGRQRMKSDLSNSVGSSQSCAEEEFDAYNDNTSSYKGPPSHFKGKKNSSPKKCSVAQDLHQPPMRMSTRKISFHPGHGGLKKKSTQYMDNSKVINTSTIDQDGSPKKKQQRRVNIAALDKQQQIWQKNWVQIMYYIGKMKKLMKQTILFFRPQLLTKWQLNSINDKACDFSNLMQHQNSDYVKQYSYQKYQRFLSFKTYKKVKKFTLTNFRFFIDMYQRMSFYVNKFEIELFQFLPIFNQLQKFYVFWELIIFICAIINIIYIPLEITFNMERTQIFKIYFEYICVLVFSTDVFIRSNTQYNEQGNKIEIHKQILANYIKKRLVIDILSIISLNRTYFQSSYASLLFFLRVFYSTRIIDIFKEQFLLRVHISGIISLILLFSQAMYFCHVFSCSFLYLGLYQIQYGEGWLVFFGLDTATKIDQYLHGYYFSVVTMTTIGYGDYTAKTNIEYCFIIVFMIVSCGIFGYTINSIGNILYDFKLKRDEFLQQLAQINKYFKFYNTDIILQSRARKYIEYTYSDNIQDTNISVTSLNSLSPYLQIEIKNDAYKKAISKNRIIKQYFSETFIEALATKMKETLLSPDQLVLEQGQSKEPSIYFVNSGMVNIYSSRNEEISTNIRKLVYGDVFGLEEFFLEKYDIPFTVKSVGVTSLLSFSLADFQELLKKYPDQVEMFCFLKDSLQYNRDFSKLQLSCFSCAQFSHCMNECPYLFYGTKKQQIIRQYLNDIEKIIVTFKRDKLRKRFNSRFLNDEVRNRADQFFLDYQDELSFSDNSDSEEDQDDSEQDNYQHVSVFASQQPSQLQQQPQPQTQGNATGEEKNQKEDQAAVFSGQKSNSMTNSVKADLESLLPPPKGSENLVYSNQNIPKSISNIPDLVPTLMKGLDTLLQRKSVAIESNILAIPSNTIMDQGERKKQRSHTSINFVPSHSEIELKPTQIYQNNIPLSKYSAVQAKQQHSQVIQSRKQSLDVEQSSGSMIVVKQTSKRNIGRQISKETNKEVQEVRDRKSTKNLDKADGGHSKGHMSEIELLFKNIATSNANNNQNQFQAKQLSYIDNLQQSQNYSTQVQPVSVELKDLVLLFQNIHMLNQFSGTQSRNIKDMESKKIDLDVQPSSKQNKLPDREESRFHRMKSKKEQLFEIELDKIYSYQIYFPKYNIDNVIERIKQQSVNQSIKNYLFKTLKKINPTSSSKIKYDFQK